MAAAITQRCKVVLTPLAARRLYVALRVALGFYPARPGRRPDGSIARRADGTIKGWTRRGIPVWKHPTLSRWAFPIVFCEHLHGTSVTMPDASIYTFDFGDASDTTVGDDDPTQLQWSEADTSADDGD